MLKVLRAEPKSTFEYGPFKIRRMRPGKISIDQEAKQGLDQDTKQDAEKNDDAFGPLSVIDHANLLTGTLVSMHEHVNDEILSYVWQGSMVHEDSTGNRTPLSSKRIMMMNAGKSFWHEESTPIVAAEMLQIFIRPRQANLEGRVQFFDRPDGIKTKEWTLLAAPEGENAPLEIRQEVYVYDVKLEHKDLIEVPQQTGFAQFLYVMDGEISAENNVLYKGDAVTGDDPLPEIESTGNSTLLCFLVKLDAEAVKDGSISGL